MKNRARNRVTSPLWGEVAEPGVAKRRRVRRVRGNMTLDKSIPPHPLAEPVIGRRFARTRWLATSPQRGEVKMTEATP